ncbi:MAG: hypothetical protein ACI4E2_00615 [Acetatifactor sp.]
MQELMVDELQNIEGGCGWCYVGAGLVIVGGYLCGGLLGAGVAAVGVAGVLLV